MFDSYLTVIERTSSSSGMRINSCVRIRFVIGVKVRVRVGFMLMVRFIQGRVIVKVGFGFAFTST